MLYNPYRYFNDLFDSFFIDTLTATSKEYFYMQKDEETKEEYLEVELPGYKKEDTKVSIENGKLYINSERKGKKYEKIVTLPKTLDLDKCRSTMEDGVLRIYFKDKIEPPPSNKKEIKIE